MICQRLIDAINSETLFDGHFKVLPVFISRSKIVERIPVHFSALEIGPLSFFEQKRNCLLLFKHSLTLSQYFKFLFLTQKTLEPNSINKFAIKNIFICFGNLTE